MPFSDSYRTDLARLQATEASLRKDLNRHEEDAARARAEAAKSHDAAARTTSISSRSSYARSAEREGRKALDASRKAADVSRRLADNASAQADKRRALEGAEKNERQAEEREAERRRRREADHARDMAKERTAAGRDDERRRRREVEHAREMARMTQPAVRYVHVRAPEPERLRVLYLTANPAMDLRTEAEVRGVQQALRGSRYRDRVEVSQRPAATAQDLLDGINDVRPHIVHFSGHGGGAGLLFENGSIDEPEGRSLSFDLLAKPLAATDTPPALLVLNACDTLDGANAILPAVPVVVAMSDAIPDLAAALFAEQFYAAIASAQSVGAALRQARVKMQLALLEEVGTLAEHAARDDVDLDNLVLVVALDGSASPFT